MSKARLTAAADTPEQRTVRAFLNAHADLADVHATNADGHNAAHVALEDFRCHTAAASQVILLLRSLDPLALTERTGGGQPTGQAPIHLITSGADQMPERMEICRELLRLSASINARNIQGATPLHRAAGTGAVEMVRMLLELRANHSIENERGATPLDGCLRSNWEVQYMIVL